jgi:hypothetical protein
MAPSSYNVAACRRVGASTAKTRRAFQHKQQKRQNSYQPEKLFKMKIAGVAFEFMCTIF